MDYDFTNFRAVYDEYTDAITGARAQWVAENLERWFRHLDRSFHSALIIKRLEDGLDFDAFYAASEKTAGKSLRLGRLVFPDDDEEHRLGYQLLLFRRIAEQKLNPVDIALRFSYTTGDRNDLVRQLNDPIFKPMAKELRRYLESEISKADTANEIPASNRLSAPPLSY